MATTQRIYLIGSNDPALPTRLVKATVRQQALTHVAQSVFTVRVATQDDLVQGLSSGMKIENAADADQHQLPL
jgi:hypothetical protein